MCFLRKTNKVIIMCGTVALNTEYMPGEEEMKSCSKCIISEFIVED